MWLIHVFGSTSTSSMVTQENKVQILAASLVALLGSATWTPSARAESIDYEPEALGPWYHVTTAPQCLPASPADAAKLNLYHGAWIFESGKTGTAVLTCAIPWPSAYIDGNSTTKGLLFPRGLFSYRDSTGKGSSASVKLSLYQRRHGSGRYTFLGEVFSSEAHSQTRDTSHYGSRIQTSASLKGGYVFMRLKMRRDSASDIVAFSHVLWTARPPEYSSKIEEHTEAYMSVQVDDDSTQASGY